MQAKTRTNQGGSVINFLIVGVVLVVIALGALFFAQQRGKDVAIGPKAPVTVSPAPSAQSSSPSPSSSPAPSSSPKPSSSAAPTTPPVVPSTGSMPSTGPSDNMVVSSLPLVLMVLVAAAYIQSRRATS